jgi:Chaperone of endosialidase
MDRSSAEGPLIPNDPPAEPRIESQEPAPAVSRKPYAAPRLTTHGRLSGLTLVTSVPISDRQAKERFEAIEPSAILAEVRRLPIECWSYKGEPARHLGPMAQDFAAAFGLGPDDRHIFPLDAAGVALAAIQALHGLVERQARRLARLESELTVLQREAAALRAELAVRDGALVR